MTFPKGILEDIVISLVKKTKRQLIQIPIICIACISWILKEPHEESWVVVN